MSHTKFWLFFVVLNLVFLLEIYSLSWTEVNRNDFQRKSKLIFVHVLFRHGDRNPVQQNPGDPYDIKYWPEGWGQLTALGKRQQYNQGKWLRKRYSDFLSPTYNPDDIYVQSSDVDRTLMSAESNLAGLYTPEGLGFQIWQRFLPWQPIPVHTQPVSTDSLIAGVPTSCSSYQKAYQNYLQSPEIKTKEEQAKPFFDLLSAKTGATVNSLMNLTMVRDSWICEIAHNLPIPKWATPLMQNEAFYNSTLAFYYTFSATPYLAKYFSGFLLKDILDRLTSKVEKTLTPDRKFWVYSSHDANVFSFLQSLGIGDNRFAGYCSTVILELRSYKNENYVQIFYKNDADANSTPNPIDIPGCGIACPLQKLYELYDKILPKNSFDIECQIDD